MDSITGPIRQYVSNVCSIHSNILFCSRSTLSPNSVNRFSALVEFLEQHTNATEYDLEPIILDIIDVIDQFQDLQSQNPNLTVHAVSLHNVTSTMNRTELGFPHWPHWPQYFTEPHEFTVLNFTLFSTIEDFWSAEAYPLALIVAIWSGVWPYVKLLLLLVIWLCPMKSSLRKKTLVILDQLGKWSFIDLYVLMMMVVSFYITIALKVDFVITAGVDVDITEEIDRGFVIFTIIVILIIYPLFN